MVRGSPPGRGAPFFLLKKLRNKNFFCNRRIKYVDQNRFHNKATIPRRKWFGSPARGRRPFDCATRTMSRRLDLPSCRVYATPSLLYTMQMLESVTKCRVCGSAELTPFFDLGAQPFAHALLKESSAKDPR